MHMPRHRWFRRLALALRRTAPLANMLSCPSLAAEEAIAKRPGGTSTFTLVHGAFVQSGEVRRHRLTRGGSLAAMWRFGAVLDSPD